MELKKFLWMFKKDILSLWRNKPRLVSIIAFPIIMIALFGYGMGGSIEHIPIAIVNMSDGDLTSNTVDAINNISIYDVKNITNDVELGKHLVDKGDVKATIILPANYDDLTNIQTKDVTLYLDSSDQIASQALVPTTEQLFIGLNNKLSIEKLSKLSSPGTNSGVSVISGASSIIDTIKLEINNIYGDIKYIDFLVPAVLAMTLMFSCMMGMGQSISGERETGELARLFMTPTNVSTVVGGKILSKLTIEIVRALILLITAIVLFGIVIKGSILLAIGMLILGALSFVGFGIMISASTSTQEDYMQMVMPVSMPMMFVSGVFYPIETMPWIFQKIAYICPLTYLNDAMRSIMIKGSGIGDIWIDVVVLLGFTAIFFILGVIKFNRDV
ncbi:MAG: ABC transporter permease [Methanobrevibacter sp.]|jgi:ABC-2 type transport system permease protein|nr:ABC transporter permease [Candidatus Methanovirga meridionalis]